MPRPVPVTTVRSHLFQLVRRLQDGGDVVVLTQRDAPVAVLMSHEEYERLLETLELLCDPEFLNDFRRFGDPALRAS